MAAVTALPHRLARCCWCDGALYKLDQHYWCRKSACMTRQAAHSLSYKDQKTGEPRWIYVPTPKQVVFEEAASVPYVLYGGAAGGAKSHAGRWSMWKKLLSLQGYEGLLLRQTFPELERTHLRKFERETAFFQRLGIKVDFAKSARTVTFHEKGSLIECGHMDDDAAVDKYLSSEYAEIGADEASLFQPGPLLEISSRSVKRAPTPAVKAAGGPWFRVYTNPGGPAASMLRDFFIDHQPDFDERPQLRKHYKPSEWLYIEAKLEDNPYLDDDYEASLAVNDEVRYKQLREADWRVTNGQFFTAWRPIRDGQPYHVQDLGKIRGVEWIRSVDWGRTNPGCVLWVACLPDRHVHVAAELKFLDRDIRDVCTDVKTIDAELGVSRVRYTVADPALFNRSQETGDTIADQFQKFGVPLRRGDNNRLNGWETVRKFLSDDGHGQPWMTVAPRCKYLIRTIPAQQCDKHDPEDLDTNGDDHACDALRYLLRTRPAPTRPLTAERPADCLGAWVDDIRAASEQVAV